MTTSLGGTTLINPERDGVQIERVPLAEAKRMLDGSLRVRYRTYKARVTLTWRMLTASERGTLWTAYLAALATSSALVLPDGQTFNVMTAANQWQERPWFDYNSTPYYDISFSMDEV